MKVSELKLELDAFSAEVRVRFAEIDTRFAHIEARIANEGETTRPHFDVVAESLRMEVRNGLAVIAAAQQRPDDNYGEHQTFTGILDDHKSRLKALEHYRRPR